MEEDIEKELVLSKIDYAISMIKNYKELNLDELIKLLIEIEKDVKEL